MKVVELVSGYFIIGNIHQKHPEATCSLGEGYIYILFTFSFWLASLSMVPYLTDRLFLWLVWTEGRDGQGRHYIQCWMSYLFMMSK